MEHFRKLCRLAGEAVTRYRMIGEGDRIAVGLSGGKDSFVLMHVLHHLQQKAPVAFELAGVTFDPGYPEFHAEKIAAYCKENHWEHHIVSLDMPGILKEKQWEEAPCVLCSRLRRGKLYGAAAELKCGKLALGQHLDDAAASFLMSACRGQGLKTMAPVVHPAEAAHPAVIRPLILAGEELIQECAQEFELPEAGKCLYQDVLESGDRAFFKQLVAQLADRIPNVRSNLARSFAHVEAHHLFLLPK